MRIDVIGAVLLCVLLVTLAIPVIQDATTDQETRDQTGSGTAYGTGSITIYKTSSGIVANGQTVTAPSGIILWNDTMYISGNYLYVMDSGSMRSYSLSSVWTLRLTSSGTLTIFTESGSGSSYQAIERYSGSVSLLSTYHLKPTGTYVYIGSTTSTDGVRLDADSQVIGLALGSAYSLIYGDPENAASHTQRADGATGGATLNAVWSGAERCYTMSNLIGEINGAAVSPDALFVPSTYYVETDKDGIAAQMLRVLPLIIAIGIAASLAVALGRRV